MNLEKIIKKTALGVATLATLLPAQLDAQAKFLFTKPVAGTSRFQIYIGDADSNTTKKLYDSSLGRVRFSPDGQRIATLNDKGQMILLDLQGRVTHRVPGAENDFVFADNNTIFWGVYPSNITRWNTQFEPEAMYIVRSFVFPHSPTINPLADNLAFAIHSYGTRCDIHVGQKSKVAWLTSINIGNTGWNENISLQWISKNELSWKNSGAGVIGHWNTASSKYRTHKLGHNITDMKISQNLNYMAAWGDNMLSILPTTNLKDSIIAPAQRVVLPGRIYASSIAFGWANDGNHYAIAGADQAGKCKIQIFDRSGQEYAFTNTDTRQVADIDWNNVAPTRLITTDVKSGLVQPMEFKILPPYPNPFNGSTNISYELNKSAHVDIEVYDVLGRKIVDVVDENQNPGYYSKPVDFSKYASGMYMMVSRVDGVPDTKKMIYTR